MRARLTGRSCAEEEPEKLEHTSKCDARRVREAKHVARVFPHADETFDAPKRMETVES